MTTEELKEQARELIMDMQVEINTHQDGDAFIREYTMNAAQLDYLIDKTVQMTEERIWKEVKKVSWRVSSSPKREYNVHREDIKNILTSLTNKSNINNNKK